MSTQSVGAINQAFGAARDQVYTNMTALLTDTNMTPGQKSAALLDAQAALGISDGVQNIISKGYDRWSQTGQ